MTAAPAGPPPPGEAPDDAPATVGELRTLRRWLLVAGVWAVAATAIAIIALLDDDSQPAPADNASASRLERLERDLSGRIDDLSQKVDDGASSEDVKRLQDRLEQAEEDASKAADDSRRARQSLSDLDDRVGELEDRVDALAAQGDGGPDPGTGEGQ